MLRGYLRKYRTMVLASVVFFYLGCCLTINFTRIECANKTSSKKELETQVQSLSKVQYVVIILSSPNNDLHRDAVRTTWGNYVNNIFVENGEIIYKWNHNSMSEQSQRNVIKLLFVVGTLGLSGIKADKLRNEQKRNKDILILDNIEDTYKNLSLKVLNALSWISENLKEMKYVIKCDDDSFVRIDLIVKNLNAFAPNMNAPELNKFVTFKEQLPTYKGLYWGYFSGHAEVFLTGRWQEKGWFLCDKYLPYALGGGYVISRRIVDYIAQNMDLLSYYNAEDVSMGVWTASLNAINRVHDVRFDTEWKSRGCKDNMLIRHKQTSSDMFQMHKSLAQSDGHKLCGTEEINRKTYFYNWNVLPSACCKRN
ncbi:beta-1,3-galactosyltransferase 6 [Papilio machaon]|uniref:beta-1,3-galactosyltransferase 6 n=1 Tax=Papilio machaon TaxID=76193 RepID=UPI001E663813|nr:beta-1,3-galactosyltransferase 6 [Papilio machaon]